MSPRHNNIMDESELNSLASHIDRCLPKGMGFFLLVAPTGDVPDRRSQYVSNCSRKDIINVMKEWLIQCGHEEDWMKDVT